MEKTLSIIKPDAVERGLSGNIIADIEARGLRVVDIKRIKLTKELAEGFYSVHKDRPFFSELTTYMQRSPVIIMVLEAKDAVVKYREAMGATNPTEADYGTIRAKYALSIGENSVHGSDSLSNAENEIKFFFK